MLTLEISSKNKTKKQAHAPRSPHASASYGRIYSRVEADVTPQQKLGSGWRDKCKNALKEMIEKGELFKDVSF